VNELRKKEKKNPVTPFRSITIFQPSYYRRYPSHSVELLGTWIIFIRGL
jgi:hypothetical protein